MTCPTGDDEEDLELAPLLPNGGGESKHGNGKGSGNGNGYDAAQQQSRLRAYTEDKTGAAAVPPSSIFWIDEGTIGFHMMLQRRQTENPWRAVVWRIATFFVLLL